MKRLFSILAMAGLFVLKYKYGKRKSECNSFKSIFNSGFSYYSDASR